MGATIRDVAKAAGVGLGTVSRVLNNSPLVSRETRRRVQAVISELQYTPSQIARNFASGHTLTIATIAPFFTRPSVVERLRGIEETLSASNYHLEVFNVETPARRDSCLRQVPRRDRADGLLIISLTLHADELAALHESGVPVVLIDSESAELPSVLIDDVYGGELATSHLIALGHTRIAFIGDAHEEVRAFNFTSSQNRRRGYLHALEQHGIPACPAYQRHAIHGRSEARLLAHELLRLPEPPTAIFAASDTQAMGVLEAARDLGVQVPAQLSVIGFDDIDVAEYLGLTTIHQRLFESGARGVQRLLDLLRGDERPPMREYLPIELIPRGTTAAPCAAKVVV